MLTRLTYLNRIHSWYSYHFGGSSSQERRQSKKNNGKRERKTKIKKNEKKWRWTRRMVAMGDGIEGNRYENSRTVLWRLKVKGEDVCSESMEGRRREYPGVFRKVWVTVKADWFRGSWGRGRCKRSSVDVSLSRATLEHHSSISCFRKTVEPIFELKHFGLLNEVTTKAPNSEEKVEPV